MANLIVASFRKDGKSIRAIQELKQLALFGDITLFAYSMLRRTCSGTYEIFYEEGTEHIWRNFTGSTTSNFIGNLTGPVGLTIELITGKVIGGIADSNHYYFDDAFLCEITKKMEEGTIVIIAEVGEDNHIFIEEALEPLGAIILRTDADIEHQEYVDEELEEIEEVEERIEDAREEMKNVANEDRIAISTKIKELKLKRKTIIEELESKRKSKVVALKMRTQNGIENIKSRLQKGEDSITESITQAKAERLKKRIKKHEGRLAKLNESLEEVLA